MDSDNPDILPNFTFPIEIDKSSIYMQTISDGQLLEFDSERHNTSSSGGKAVSPGKVKCKNNAGSSSDDYQKRRTRNNIAVKKSREKTKQKGTMTMETIDKLKEENAELEKRVEILNDELARIKKVFMDHARGFSGSESELPDLEHLEKLLGRKLTEKVSTIDQSSCSSNLS